MCSAGYNPRNSADLVWHKRCQRTGHHKLPDGEASQLIEQPIPTALIAKTGRPQGDMAFAAAVAAFGQKLRGDTRLVGFDYADIIRLTGSQSDYWRQECVQLANLAASRDHANGVGNAGD